MSDEPRVYTLENVDEPNDFLDNRRVNLLLHNNDAESTTGTTIQLSYRYHQDECRRRGLPANRTSLSLLELPTPDSSAEFVAESLGQVLEAAGATTVEWAIGRAIYVLREAPEEGIQREYNLEAAELLDRFMPRRKAVGLSDSLRPAEGNAEEGDQ